MTRYDKDDRYGLQPLRGWNKIPRNALPQVMENVPEAIAQKAAKIFPPT